MANRSLTYTLEIDGSPAAPELLDALLQVEVEDHADLADVARLRLSAAVAPRTSGWTVVDDPICERLANVRIGVRIGGDRAVPLIDAYVIDVRATLSADPGSSVVEVVAMDATVLMDLEEKVRAWPDQSDSSIADSVFSEYGFDTDVQSVDLVRQERDVLVMQRGTDIQFLQGLAQRNGFECFVEVGDDGRTTGHFHAPRLEQDAQAILSVNLGTETNLDGFKGRHDMLAATTVTGAGVEVADATAQDAQAANAEAKTLGKETAVSGDRPRVRLLAGTGLFATGELQTMAQASVDRSAFAITATGDVNIAALPQVLRAKRPVNVRGAGGRFSGQYYVQKVLHTFAGPSYRQRLSMKRNAVGLAGSERFTASDAVAGTQAVQV